MKPFLQISIGISIMLLSGSLFIRSIQTASAAPAPQPKEFIEEGTNKIGTYMMQYSEVVNASDQSEYHILVWDTQTGKSEDYAWSFSSSTWKPTGGLPENPLNK